MLRISDITARQQVKHSRPGFANAVVFRNQVARKCMKVCKTAMMDTPSAVSQNPGSSENSRAVLLQGFGWDSCTKSGWYRTVKSRIPDMQDMHITHLWLPPPSQSVSPQGYMPGQLYNLNSKYGNKEDLVALNQALAAAGIKPIADIVINHRCADEQENGVWNKFRDDVVHPGRSVAWGRWAITNNDPSYQGGGSPDTGDDYGPAPDLDHNNEEVRESLKDWLHWLQSDIGFTAWRLDFVKGYGANFVKEYISTTSTALELNVGEYWTDLKWNGKELEYNQDASRQRLVDWINANGKTCSGFDFPTKGILQEAVKHTQYWRLKDNSGKAPGGIGWMPGHCVTFIDNHDTGSTQQHWPFPADQITLGYAYIMTHPGMPCVFWDHAMEWGKDVRESIKGLIALRSRNGLHSRSKLEILYAEADMYVAKIDDKVVIKMGPRFDMGSLVPSASQGWKFALSGKNWAVWEKSQ